MLATLTAVVHRGDREPVVVSTAGADGTTYTAIVAGGFARLPSDPWSIPSGQSMDLAGELTRAGARMVRMLTPAKVHGGQIVAVHPVDHVASDLRAELARVVVRWVGQALKAQRTPPTVVTLPALAQWLERQVSWIVLQEWSAEMLRDVQRVTKRAIRAIDRPADRVYLGPCGQQGRAGTCAGDLIAEVGDSYVQCPRCGTTVSVAERRSELMEAAMDMWLTATEIWRLSRELAGVNQTLVIPAETVRTWHKRGQILADVGSSPHRYLLREVMAQAEKSRSRRGRQKVA